MVTKGLSRKAVILAKFTVAAILMTLCYWVSYGAAYGYTCLLYTSFKAGYQALIGIGGWIRPCTQGGRMLQQAPDKIMGLTA